MASKRRNMFHKNKTQETTENGLSPPAVCPCLGALTPLLTVVGGTTDDGCLLLLHPAILTFFSIKDNKSHVLLSVASRLLSLSNMFGACTPSSATLRKRAIAIDSCGVSVSSTGRVSGCQGALTTRAALILTPVQKSDTSTRLPLPSGYSLLSGSLASGGRDGVAELGRQLVGGAGHQPPASTRAVHPTPPVPPPSDGSLVFPNCSVVSELAYIRSMLAPPPPRSLLCPTVHSFPERVRRVFKNNLRMATGYLNF
ncbi:hypothetical protein AAG570_002760 [Ranatra chinensis]|uniref:Uncharacterized protein n=1 Tax=Ranatra chinensis TaxID=642074 RepID=A0ABD0YTA2_9HEMI